MPVETVVYFLYPNLNNPERVLYLRKDRPGREHLDEKLVGLGGLVEEGEDPLAGAKREVGQEALFLQEQTAGYFQQGRVCPTEDLVVYVFKAPLKTHVDTQILKGEGWLQMFPLDFHRSHPERFPEGDVQMLDKLLYTHKAFRLHY